MTELLEIFVKLPTGKTIQLQVEAISSCATLKFLLIPWLMHPSQDEADPNQFVLSFSGTLLHGSRSLSEYNIQQDSTVHALVKDHPQDILNFDECQQCHFQAVDPRVLPCGHSCCRTCLPLDEGSCPAGFCLHPLKPEACPANWLASHFFYPKPSRPTRKFPFPTCTPHGEPCYQICLDHRCFLCCECRLAHEGHNTKNVTEYSASVAKELVAPISTLTDNSIPKQKHLLEIRKETNLAEIAKLQRENRIIDQRLHKIAENAPKLEPTAAVLKKAVEVFPDHDLLDFTKLGILRTRINQSVKILKENDIHQERLIKPQIILVGDDGRRAKLVDLILSNRVQTLVLVRERFTAGILKEHLMKTIGEGLVVDYLHGKMADRSSRFAVWKSFTEGAIQVLIATPTVLKENFGWVDHIIHYDLPANYEELYYSVSSSSKDKECVVSTFYDHAYDSPRATPGIKILDFIEAQGHQIDEKTRYYMKLRAPEVALPLPPRWDPRFLNPSWPK